MTKRRFRGHHIYCLRFSRLEFPERGAHFADVYAGVKSALEEDSEAMMQVVAEPDDVCQACTLYANGGCQSKHGGEAAVCKWDHIILAGLGLTPGDELTMKQYQALVQEKSPLGFCYRCRADGTCTMHARVSEKDDPPR